MKRKNFIILIIVYITSLTLGTICFISSFWINIFQSYDFLFIRAIILLLFSCIFITLLLFYLKKVNSTIKSIITYRDILLIFTILFFSNYTLYGMIPFNVSRSNSIILVGYLYKNSNTPKTEKEITDYIINKYFIDYNAISKRLQEQISVGNIKKTKNGYMLTEKGRKVVDTFRFITELYNIKKHFLQLDIEKNK